MIANLKSAEEKYLAPWSCEARARSLLQHFCKPDPLYPLNKVCSIYYDTASQNSFLEKENGDYFKEKIRLRWYEDKTASASGPVTGYLERKSKAGSTRSKARVKLPFSLEYLKQTPLSDPGLACLPSKHREQLGALDPHRYTPSLTVLYWRSRFVCPISGARICLDTGICCDRVNTRVLPHAYRPRLALIVMEIKDGQLEPCLWLEHIQAAGFMRSSFSKYGSCFAEVLQGGGYE